MTEVEQEHPPRVDSARRRPGGRTARTRSAVLESVVAELAERGYAELSIDGVAARCGVNRATIYRRWGSKDGLLVDALESFAVEQASVSDTGDLDADLAAWARSVLRMLMGPVSGAVIRAVFSGAGTSAAASQLRHRFWLVRSALILPVVEGAVRRGDLPAGTDPEEVVRSVSAPLYYRLLVLDEALTPDLAERAAAATLAAARAGVFVRREEDLDARLVHG